mgnify:CR=1 FL=1
MIAQLSPTLAHWLARGEAAIVIRIDDAFGSTPRDAGATMIVSATDAHGTIGGGQLEFHAIDIARAMIASGEPHRALDIPLGPHLGQCCGGRVALHLQRADDAQLAKLSRIEAARDAGAPHILVFGAGHTGRALARTLALLPARTTLIDDRGGLFDNLPAAIATRLLDDPTHAIADAPPAAAFIVMTHSHALDYALTDAALRRGDAAYVGMIGSITKRVRFEKWFLQRNGRRDQLARLNCPIGGKTSQDKRPEIIAAIATADIAIAAFKTTKHAKENNNERAA